MIKRSALVFVAAWLVMSVVGEILGQEPQTQKSALTQAASRSSDITTRPAGKPVAKRLTLRAVGVPESSGTDVESMAQLAIMEEFEKRYPHIQPVSTTGLQIPGKTMDMAPLMQIAGDIPPEVMYVNFRQSSTYIMQKFLYPLDLYIEKMVGVDVPDRHLLKTPQYIERLKKGAGYESEIARRVPDQCWEVMRRACPYGQDCPYLAQWGVKPAKDHSHVWAFPEGPAVMAMFYRKDLFAEANLPDRPPRDLDEMFEWAKKLTKPKLKRYGLKMHIELSWPTLGILYSMGGRVVEQKDRVRSSGCNWDGYVRKDQAQCPQCGKEDLVCQRDDLSGDWYCAFDSEQAVNAYYFVARLFLEPFKIDTGDEVKGTVYLDNDTAVPEIATAMEFNYLNQKVFSQINPAVTGFGPVPVYMKRDRDGNLVRDAEGKPQWGRGSEFNSQMFGIFAGLDEEKRDAAWEYVRFYDGPEANLTRTRVFVDNGQAQFVRPSLLRQAGLAEYITPQHEAWEDAYQFALKFGVPEPYGKNCQLVYTYVTKAISEILDDEKVKAAIKSGPAGEVEAKARIREILKGAVTRSNEKMLNILTPEEQSFRNTVATVVAVAILIIFILVFRKVFKVFSQVNPIDKRDKDKSQWQFGKHKWAYILMLPALLSIGMWAYWPLVRGTIIAFQDYNVRGFSQFVGMDNFANVLFNFEFWHAMWISLKYAFYSILFGFGAPIVLAFLLTEVPKGKIIYRTIYYLPAVLTGVIVIFLWKGFYGSAGMINQVLNYGVDFLNWMCAGLWPLLAQKWEPIAAFDQDWVRSPSMALFFCVLPSIWAGMGPGCLIYLAALKTVPEEIYEAADIDGAGVWQKLTQVSIPSIKALIMINFIGAVIGAVKSGGGFMLAMTGGGPFNPYGQTEVVGLHIWFEAYGFLRFGAATAMAWVLGSMLIGFTVLQLQRLSRMEFRTAATAKR